MHSRPEGNACSFSRFTKKEKENSEMSNLYLNRTRSQIDRELIQMFCF